MRENIIVKYFKKCSTSNALGGSEYHLIYEEVNNGDEREKKKVEMTIFRDFKFQFGFINKKFFSFFLV